MKIRLFKLIIILSITALLIWRSGIIPKILRPPTAYAVGGLLIDWGVTPGQAIFTINNLAPGDSQTREVIVRNESTDPLPVGIRGIRKSETGNLASALDIIISANDKEIFGGSSQTGPKTVRQLFDEAPLPAFIRLSDLNRNQKITYTVKVTFRRSAANEFQNKNLTFDLKLGPAYTIPQACNNIHFTTEPVYGTNKNDILNGTKNNDLIFALQGNDIINAKGGDDCVVAGAGNDVVNAGTGNDVVTGDNGNDVLNGENGNDTLFSGAGKDIINGGTGKDSCSGSNQTSCEINLNVPI